MTAKKTIFQRKDAPDKENGDKDKLNRLVKKTQRVLLRINTVFPFDFFTTTIIVDENKVDIIRRNFLFSEEVQSILIKDIISVILDSSVFFASLRFEVKDVKEPYEPIHYLWKKDAFKAKEIITGLIALVGEKIDPTAMDTKELIKKVKEIGVASED